MLLPKIRQQQLSKSKRSGSGDLSPMSADWGCWSSQPRPMHHEPREAPDHENDPAPEPRCIDNRLSPLNSAYDVQRDALRLSPQRPGLRQVGRHRRRDEARANVEHGHAVAMEPVP